MAEIVARLSTIEARLAEKKPSRKKTAETK